MSRQRILLAASDSVFEERLQAAYKGALNGDLRRLDLTPDELSQPQRGVETIAGASPDVVAVGPALDVEQALALAQVLDLEHPGISIMLVADRTPQVLEAALRAGVRDIVPPTADDAELRESFDRAIETAQRRRASMGIEAGPSGPRTRVITVVSPKGGSGKTTIATNLALGLAGLNAGKVAIVDLDLQFGDVSTAMRLMPEHSIADAARAGASLNTMGLKVLLTPHPSGLFALAAPETPAEGEEVSADIAGRAVQLLADEFQYVVIDTSAGVTESTLAAIEVSTDLVLLCTFDVPSVRSLRKIVLALDQLGMIHQRRHFVLNRADSRVGLMTEDVEATVGMTVDVAVSSSRSVPLAMNQGSPLLESDPRSPVARQMMELTNRFAEVPVQQPSGSRLFKRSGR